MRLPDSMLTAALPQPKTMLPICGPTRVVTARVVGARPLRNGTFLWASYRGVVGTPNQIQAGRAGIGYVAVLHADIDAAGAVECGTQPVAPRTHRAPRDRDRQVLPYHVPGACSGHDRVEQGDDNVRPSGEWRQRQEVQKPGRLIDMVLARRVEQLERADGVKAAALCEWIRGWSGDVSGHGEARAI